MGGAEGSVLKQFRPSCDMGRPARRKTHSPELNAPREPDPFPETRKRAGTSPWDEAITGQDMREQFDANPDAYTRIMNNDLLPAVYRRRNAKQD